MGEEDLERYETDVELKIYREYRDVLPMFRYVVETERLGSTWRIASTSRLERPMVPSTSSWSSTTHGSGICIDRLDSSSASRS